MNAIQKLTGLLDEQKELEKKIEAARKAVAKQIRKEGGFDEIYKLCSGLPWRASSISKYKTEGCMIIDVYSIPKDVEQKLIAAINAVVEAVGKETVTTYFSWGIDFDSKNYYLEYFHIKIFDKFNPVYIETLKAFLKKYNLKLDLSQEYGYIENTRKKLKEHEEYIKTMEQYSFSK